MKKIFCTLVTYNGASTVLDCLASVFKSHRRPEVVYIIDNGSSDNTLALISQHYEKMVEIVALGENRGVAYAYNLASSKAKELGFDYLWLLDQDSVCDPACLALLVSAIQENEINSGACFPLSFEKSFPALYLFPHNWTGAGFETISFDPLKNLEPFPVDSSITSGALYNLMALQKAGPFRDDYFIDFVDHNMHTRIRAAGFVNLLVPAARLAHSLGSCIQSASGSNYHVHPSWRYYYIARNMAAEHWRLGGISGLIHFLRFARQWKKSARLVGFFLPAMDRNINAGIFDFFISRMGKRK